MQVGKPEESARKFGRLLVAVNVGLLICMGALIPSLVLDAVQLGLDWTNPWTDTKRNGGKLGGLTFLTYVGFSSAFGIWILGHLRRWATAQRWMYAALAIQFAFTLSRFALDPEISSAVRAAFFGSIGLMVALVISLSWRNRRRAAKKMATKPTEGA